MAAEEIFAGEMQTADGGTVDDHARRATRKPMTREEFLATPLKRWRKVAPRKRKPPEELAYLLNWYREIRSGNPFGMHAEPLSQTEMRSFSINHRLRIESWEFDVLSRLDTAWRSCLPKPEK